MLAQKLAPLVIAAKSMTEENDGRQRSVDREIDPHRQVALAGHARRREIQSLHRGGVDSERAAGFGFGRAKAGESKQQRKQQAENQFHAIQTAAGGKLLPALAGHLSFLLTLNQFAYG